ncbi:aromatic-ring-hydroxylating dioxygenase subunit beta [Rhizorhabdus argentea]|uniref:aromatic-ring-hydroxylating dioxygenase subunit beta n=1 Tax=Rhizorhabdus argentea TaxID=1387174 RepID=UPI0030EC4DF7
MNIPAASDVGTSPPVSALRKALNLQCGDRALHQEMVDLLYYEAWLLDNDKFEDWLELIAADASYVAPIRRKIADEGLTLASLDDHTVHVGHFNDGKMELGLRIARMRTGFDHYNRPASLSRRIIGNIRILGRDTAADTVTLTSNFLVFRAREEREETLFAGARDDVWRRTGKEWELVRRLIKLDHHMVPPLSQIF